MEFHPFYVKRFPAKEVSKEEFLPKFDDMKVEDISYLTKGEAAGANYCCRCNVTLASPWEIRQHLRTKSHRESSADEESEHVFLLNCEPT
ncbi:hypothetical protein Pmar_PMAR019333 [Perkinsus marinus ATCC 50983]|uniref:Uncharacterized protein n=1 Tax=Perkinsus marinus (strain ATCC 50983 / TXsc) TaxID=423536 RepID=C5KFV0_PERM5|nr:hypothetical protein Pmar_PMAR019333 [Perkinsus marinus ATCC 50983]EER16652.1 hypothetical protein Pmar_PMAR019333 [Perkinsus marinus ATCC 50983]|eukprot:XP_002784856.1 hypothetical protein Pmar_PMAR019333 [Perkinsus marinus ATCC 50983]